jgi:hypothetical protein
MSASIIRATSSSIDRRVKIHLSKDNPMKVTITRLYDDYAAARSAVMDLEAADLPTEDISLIASNASNWYDGKPGKCKHDSDGNGVDDRVEGAEMGAGIGAVLAGGAGLLAGLGVMAIPGLGPVVAAGWLASTGLGAVAGAAAGGIVGALTQAGVSEQEAAVYAEGVRRGGTLLSARVPAEDRVRYEAILDHSAVDINGRRQVYLNAGWNGYDPLATVEGTRHGPVK